MKRRRFLGFLAGGAIAGPGMVKSAAAQTMADLNLGALGLSAGAGMAPGPVGNVVGGSDWATRGLAELLGRTALEHAKAKREVWLQGLDADIAALGSVSLATKIRMQRERTYSAHLESQRNYFERAIAEMIGV